MAVSSCNGAQRFHVQMKDTQVQTLNWTWSQQAAENDYLIATYLHSRLLLVLL